ncbi:threonine ammonia-lyase, biosynthetic [Mesoterricola sediminis]|uniref:L-threonine dehydratase n=1 Tax=Mesoterricola sediminis TaxID=2927980 RepID=A0AA48KDE7_9BACT|nr:threonine ammonia-lyase, biosynthetic [Mesoterricola sediminis]BDU78126.1 L-threonine dehydratase [Mesoterricola sediminis]
MPAAPILSAMLTAPVYEVALETPLQAAPILSAALGHRVWLKREDLQPVHSFKLRGAYVKMARLSPEARARGVVAASAGNHAQGVALAASRLGCQAVIVMPVTTPVLKVEAVRRLGAEVRLHGDTFDEAAALARTLAEGGLTPVPPYDDPDVIAGQGTVGLELLRQRPGGLDAVFVPVGGGGLIAGVATCLKQLAPQVKVIGVEPADSDCLARALEAGRPVSLDHPGLFADGVAVRQVGALPFTLCRDTVDEVVRVGTDEICAAIKDVFCENRSLLEPSGALAVAGLRTWAAGRRNLDLAAILSGANLDFDRLRFVAERAGTGDSVEAVLAVTIPERPGSFLAFCELIGQRPITEFNYRRSDPEAAHVFVGVKAGGRAEARELVDRLRGAGLGALDLTDDELAKTHLRHMTWGRAPDPGREHLFRFEFPERPGALLKFLRRMAPGWDITLFHYRNHGADVGRVLAGLLVPPEDEADLLDALADLGYPWVDETASPAYRALLL